MAKSMIQNANAAQMQQVRAKKEPQNIKEYIVAMKSGIAAALPSVMTPERFTRIALSAVSNNPKLQACTPDSFLGAMMQAAQLGLEPNTPLGQAYLIPYGGKCQFQVGYKGLLELAWRSGEIRDIQAEVVYQNDVWEYELGLEPKLRHIPADTDRGDPVRYYAVIRTKDGGYISAVMSVEDVQAHARKYSQSYNNGPWKTSFDEMAKKTVMKRALKYAPLKSDFVTRALAADGTVKTELSDDMTQIPDVTEYVEAEPVSVDGSTGEVIEGA